MSFGLTFRWHGGELVHLANAGAPRRGTRLRPAEPRITEYARGVGRRSMRGNPSVPVRENSGGKNQSRGDGNAVAGATLTYRVMFGGETAVPMDD